MSKITEDDLVELGFSKHLMIGTGYTSTSSMTPAIYYYKKDRLVINATTFWTWFLDGEQRNDFAVSSKESLSTLINELNKQTNE